MSVYDPSQDVCSAPAAKPAQTTANQLATSPPGVTALVNQNPPAALRCLSEAAAAAAAAGNLVRAAGAMAVVSPTVLGAIPAIAGFIGSAIVAGAAAAALANCEESAAAKAKAH